MVDLRERVEEDRGLLKKIQLFIPGFAGYRRREDLRQADNMLRIQMANGLKRLREDLEECRHSMLEDYETKNLEKVGSVINKARTMEGKVRHAEQGYSGFSPAIRIVEAELDQLYQFDVSMIDLIQRMGEQTGGLKDASDSGDSSRIGELLVGIKDAMKDFERIFDERMPRIAGIYNM